MVRHSSRIPLAFALACLSSAACGSDTRALAPTRVGSFVSHPLVTEDERPLHIDRPSCGAFGLGKQIAICEGGERQIVVLDSTGREQWRFGRRGAGPGEFHTISGVHFDSAGRLHVFDGGRRKLVLISPTGELISDRVFHHLTGWIPRSLGELSDGRVVLLASTYQLPGVSEAEGYQRITTPVGVLDTTSRRIALLDTVTLGEQLVHGHGFERKTFGLPFSASGDAVLVGESLVYGFARDSFLVRRDVVTGATDTITIAAPAFELPQKNWDAKWEQRIANATPDFRPALTAAAKRAPRPHTYPRYVRLLATPTGSVAIYGPLDASMEQYTIRCVLTSSLDGCPTVTTSEGEIVLAIASGRALVARESTDGNYTIELWVSAPSGT